MIRLCVEGDDVSACLVDRTLIDLSCPSGYEDVKTQAVLKLVLWRERRLLNREARQLIPSQAT
ncbi:hypothetical protein NKH99_15210 [Mesorhizobium sp. M0854]|uniref:hypothetical protein n=1 Tax=Mesorhizobium sp. M0854 TaxID=2957013 RepID=UPI00333D71BB